MLRIQLHKVRILTFPRLHCQPQKWVMSGKYDPHKWVNEPKGIFYAFPPPFYGLPCTLNVTLDLHFTHVGVGEALNAAGVVGLTRALLCSTQHENVAICTCSFLPTTCHLLTSPQSSHSYSKYLTWNYVHPESKANGCWGSQSKPLLKINISIILT